MSAALVLLLLSGCMVRQETMLQPQMRTLPQANIARQYAYELRQGATLTTCLVQVLQPASEQYAWSMNHGGKVFQVQPSAKVCAGSRQLVVQFPEDSAALIPSALMFRLSDSVLHALLQKGHAGLDLVKPYRVFEADGRSRMEAELLAKVKLVNRGDTLLLVVVNDVPVLLQCRVAEAQGAGKLFRLFYSGDAQNPLLLGWDFDISVRLSRIAMPDAAPDPLALAPGTALLFLYNHPVMLQGLWDYVDDTLHLYIERSDSVLQGRYRLTGKGSYPFQGRFSYTRGSGDDPVMRMIPEYTTEDCMRFGLDCGNWFLRSAQWNNLLNKAVVKLEVNENKNAQWFAPVLNEDACFAYSRSLNMDGAQQDFNIIRLKDRMSETILDVLPNRDNPLVLYWQEGTESLELVQVIHAKRRRKP